MKENKNIDRLFQEKFKDFEMHPSDKVWSKIAATQKNEKDRKVIPFWWKVGGIAAALAILFTVGGILLNSVEITSPNIVNQENSKKENNQDLEIVPPLNGSNKIIEQNLTNVAETNSSKETVKENAIRKDANNTVSSNRVATISQQHTQQQNTNNTNISNTNETHSLNNKNAQNTQVLNSSNKGVAYNDPSQLKDDPLLGKNTISNDNTLNNNPAVNNNTTITNTKNDSKNTSIALSEDDNKKDLTVEAQKINDLKEEETAVAQNDTNKTSKWNVGAVAAPVYYGDFGGSGLDNQFSDNSKTGDVNLSYGVQVSYAVSPKLKLRTGVSTVDLSYSTNGVSFSTSGQGRSLSSINFEKDVQTLVIADAGRQELANSFIGEPTGVIGNGSLEQRFNYIEIPMEAVYTISDKRVGLSLIGGVSTLLLNDNQVLLLSDEVTTTLGTSNAVNDVSFSTNIGIGIDYKMTDKLQLNLEPSFKYQVNGFDSDAVDFNPYYLGVYTGVSYKF